ncbi:hydroxyacylglutathione hydrolase [Aliidiomarina indica]|uniref:hydroxyacylglutathione hydrolase n=1 Tax=Aliidiomarina indica TaxID=2749147 RepID=UPI0018902532|nr:hydroxyacylglutathione hydrolase [Aliidiomarina indica]
MRIHPVPAFTDNYIWVIDQHQSKQDARACVIVDPGDATPVFAYLEQENLVPEAILLTHHHWDHTGGVVELLQRYPCPVYGPHSDNIDSVTHPLREGDDIQLLDGALQLRVLECPGHTLDHIAFYNDTQLFCGDTLFAAGCGRMFEGKPDQFYQSLQKLAALPAKIKVYCAHEYTAANLRFAAAVEPNNQAISERQQQVARLRSENKVTLPSTLADELATNPFLRVEKSFVRNAAESKEKQSLSGPAEVFASIRRWKDSF